jgi:hypothetical protein
VKGSNIKAHTLALHIWWKTICHYPWTCDLRSGMQTRETAQKDFDAMTIDYNFVREHSTINETPARRHEQN